MKIQHIIYILAITVIEACMIFSTSSSAADLYIPSCTIAAQYTTDTCHPLNTGLQLLPNTNPHCFTCDTTNMEGTTCDDRSIATKQGGSCAYRGNGYSCQRCECPSGMTWKSENGARATCKCTSGRAVQDGNSRKCEACQGGKITNQNDDTQCICPEGTSEVNGKCETILEKCPDGSDKPAGGTCSPSEREACREKEEAGTHRWNHNAIKMVLGADGKPETKEDGSIKTTRGGACEDCSDPEICCGTKLNTNVPFIGNCIRIKKFGSTQTTADGTLEVTPITAFPTLVGALMRILTSAMLIIGLLLIIVAGVMMTMEGANTGSYKSGKSLILKVGAALALLGLSGLILKLINPTFFM